MHRKTTLAALTILAFIVVSASHSVAQDPASARTLRAPQHKTLSPDGKIFAVWYLDGWDETIAIHDNATGKRKKRITGHGDVVQEFRFSPDGQILAAKSRKGWRIWDLSTGKQIMMLTATKTKIPLKESKSASVPRSVNGCEDGHDALLARHQNGHER